MSKPDKQGYQKRTLELVRQFNNQVSEKDSDSETTNKARISIIAKTDLKLKSRQKSEEASKKFETVYGIKLGYRLKSLMNDEQRLSLTARDKAKPSEDERYTERGNGNNIHANKEKTELSTRKRDSDYCIRNTLFKNQVKSKAEQQSTVLDESNRTPTGKHDFCAKFSSRKKSVPIASQLPKNLSYTGLTKNNLKIISDIASNTQRTTKKPSKTQNYSHSTFRGNSSLDKSSQHIFSMLSDMKHLLNASPLKLMPISDRLPAADDADL